MKNSFIFYWSIIVWETIKNLTQCIYVPNIEQLNDLNLIFIIFEVNKRWPSTSNAKTIFLERSENWMRPDDATGKESAWRSRWENYREEEMLLCHSALLICHQPHILAHTHAHTPLNTHTHTHTPTHPHTPTPTHTHTHTPTHTHTHIFSPTLFHSLSKKIKIVCRRFRNDKFLQ